MAAARLAAPGSTYGPCQPTCEHIDCAETRKMADAACRFCGRTIGFDVRFYSDPESMTGRGLVHARCLEDDVEKKAPKGGAHV
jgi:hypothetical protein